MYDRKMHEDNPVVHFKADQIDGTRLITQFYAFLWFEDWRHDLWSKRFVRDNLRYNNEIMCLSARIISALRNHARQRSPGNVNGIYDAVHIRSKIMCLLDARENDKKIFLLLLIIFSRTSSAYYF